MHPGCLIQSTFHYSQLWISCCLTAFALPVVCGAESVALLTPSSIPAWRSCWSTALVVCAIFLQLLVRTNFAGGEVAKYTARRVLGLRGAAQRHQGAGVSLVTDHVTVDGRAFELGAALSYRPAPRRPLRDHLIWARIDGLIMLEKSIFHSIKNSHDSRMREMDHLSAYACVHEPFPVPTVGAIGCCLSSLSIQRRNNSFCGVVDLPPRVPW